MQKERNMSRARGDSNVKLTTEHETLIHSASEHAKFALDVGQFYINDSVEDGDGSTPFCRKYSEPMICQHIVSSSYRPREDRASDRNRSIRNCRSSGCRSAGTVPNTGTCEVLGTYLTRC